MFFIFYTELSDLPKHALFFQDFAIQKTCRSHVGMARKQCILVPHLQETRLENNVFLVCPPLGNMAWKQCSLVSEGLVRCSAF